MNKIMIIYAIREADYAEITPFVYVSSLYVYSSYLCYVIDRPMLLLKNKYVETGKVYY